MVGQWLGLVVLGVGGQKGQGKTRHTGSQGGSSSGPQQEGPGVSKELERFLPG
jgi:hypothetical protein